VIRLWPFAARQSLALPSHRTEMLAESGRGRKTFTSDMYSHIQFACKHGQRACFAFLASITIPLCFAALIALCACSSAPAQSASGRQQPQTKPSPDDPAGVTPANEELQTGTDLTSQGHFREAIPHLLAAQNRVSNEFAADFNLALCYTATSQYDKAIGILVNLSGAAHPSAGVYNLLAQAYVGNGQPEQAFTALQQAANLNPANEKLYALVADACMDHQNYALGVKVVNLGIENLPHSARLYYERGVFQTLLERGDLAAADFAQAAALAPDSDVAYMATAQRDLEEGKIPETIATARQGIAAGHENYILLTLLGEALIRSGIGPGQPEFSEAQTALEKSVAEHADNSRSQIALAKIYLMAGRYDDAITHLEIARQIDPANTSVYSHLAAAYRQRGQLDQAQKMLAILANLNEAQAAKIRSGPSDHKATTAPSRVE
jgi:tetratricopeptide (TPR) repeat protein